MVDIEDLLQPLSPASPCGEDLEYDPAYGALERATLGKPEQQFGNTVVEAEPPNWLDVRRQALELLRKSKDLRVASILTRALVRTEGWSGLRDGLSLIDGLLERYWESVHPHLDPEDDNDPTLRINTIFSLCDPAVMLEGLRAAPLVDSRALGRFGLRDLQIAAKEIPPPTDGKTPVPEPMAIEAAFQEVELEALQATANAIGQSRERLARIESRLLEQVGVGAAPDMTELAQVIQSAQKAIAAPLAQRTGQPAASEDALAGPASEQMAGTAKATDLPATLNAINHRADVIRALDLLCDYYRRQEPSSPIPLLLNRAKRLVSKDFLEILQDLAPDGLAQARAMRGSDPDA
ncbi:type VI secretion protein [Thiocystis minor]|nr:type VI secretion protein [Thiocystis minor]